MTHAARILLRKRLGQAFESRCSPPLGITRHRKEPPSVRQRLPGPLEGSTVTSILSAPNPPCESRPISERQDENYRCVNRIAAHTASSRLISIFWNPSNDHSISTVQRWGTPRMRTVHLTARVSASQERASAWSENEFML